MTSHPKQRQLAQRGEDYMDEVAMLIISHNNQQITNYLKYQKMQQKRPSTKPGQL